MSEAEAAAVYRQFDVKVQHHPTCGRIVRWSPRHRPGATAEQDVLIRMLVRQAVAILDPGPPVEAPEPAGQLSFLAA